MSKDHDDLRLQIITLHIHTDKSMTEIANDLGTSQSTVSRVISRYKETGEHETNYKNCGRKPIFGDRDLRRMRTVAVKNPRLSAVQIQSEIGASGDCCIRTMRNALNKAGCKAVKPYRRPFLSAIQAGKRLTWAKEHKDWNVEDNWSNVIFSDESMFAILDNCPCYVRVVDGHPLIPAHYNLTRKHPTSVMVWGCFGINGTGRACIIEGTMNSDKYCDEVVDRRVKPQLLEWYPNGDGIFQQDNAPCHTSKKSMTHMTNRGIQVLAWPPSSPDLNPIENLWGIVKRRFKTKQVTSKRGIISSFIDIWNRDPEIQEKCRILVNSMPSRIQACIEAKGYQTKY